jgi:hypothetical protein
LKRGFGGTTMDALAGRARVSKNALFAGVITVLCTEINSENFNALFTQTPRDALHDFVHRMIAIVFAPETVELHRTLIADCQWFPKLGRLL